MRRLILTAAALFMTATAAQARDLENTLYLQLKDGVVVIEMRPDLAPKHVEQIKKLAREKFYDGIVFHRVIDGFMAQTGDPTGTGSGGSKLPDLNAEFSNEKHVRGSVSMARTNDPNSANSQWFICFRETPSLDGQYTIWGKVTEGMQLVDRIKKGNPDDNGSVISPDKIITLRVAADVEKAAAPTAAAQ